MSVTSSRFDRLTDDQRKCLRLLFANLTIKEIGRELNAPPDTVKARLKSARRLLGADRSMTAALMLVQHERDTLGVHPPRSLGIERRFADAGPTTALDHPASVVRNRYNLGVLPRISLIVATAFVAVALAGATLTGAEAVTRIFRDHQIDISDPPYKP